MSETGHPHRHLPDPVEEEVGRVSRFETASELFRQLSDPTRTRIFWYLCHRESCVSDIAGLLGMSSPAVSHHLRSLTDSGLLTTRRDGKEVFYRAADREVCDLLHLTVERVIEFTCPEQESGHSETVSGTVLSVHRYLQEHLSERVTIAELSRRFLINPTTLKTSFKQVYGDSIASHFKKHRIAEAKRQLLETDRPVAEIAVSVGYDSPSRFAEAFREETGLLPARFRNVSSQGSADMEKEK
ncbi:MAG: metalloregulator ArsR/SmtB family transcription factor [Clostridia bacterium]|nr:metalloregulator ArsR/SmtB family transcription factor [Clostridia bacterium]